jgi:hypothetical protein
MNRLADLLERAREHGVAAGPPRIAYIVVVLLPQAAEEVR